ncbi:MAG: sugar phosphate isomerase/epimerase [Clostridia bacterium]|nr:sugar phosphate isomerase/epimerase [Clostridia bacterium]
MSFGMPTLVENETLDLNIRLCRRLGLKFIELNMNFPEYQLEQLEDGVKLTRAAEEAGIYYTIHLDENLNPADFNPLVAQAYLETVRRTVTAAKKLLPLIDRYGNGPMILNMHLHHGVHITLPDRKVQLYERDHSRYMADCRRFRDLCREWIGGAPLLIAVENTDGFRTYEKDAVEMFLEYPCFGLTWDIGHSAATGEKDLPFIMAHEDRLVHFHIHDGTYRPPRDHLAAGDGEIDLSARLGVALSHHCRCVLETKTSHALKKTVEWLHANFPEGNLA